VAGRVREPHALARLPPALVARAQIGHPRRSLEAISETRSLRRAGVFGPSSSLRELAVSKDTVALSRLDLGPNSPAGLRSRSLFDDFQ
jgi:hypothetical protein